MTPVVGGYLADRYPGHRKAVLFGAVILTMGHFLMAFEGDGGQDSLAINIFWLALSFIIVGSGFLKANISVIVGQLYPRTDPRRDPAYTIFYMRSEEHTSELQSLMRTSYAVFCLKQNKHN